MLLRLMLYKGGFSLYPATRPENKDILVFDWFGKFSHMKSLIFQQKLFSLGNRVECKMVKWNDQIWKGAKVKKQRRLIILLR